MRKYKKILNKIIKWLIPLLYYILLYYIVIDIFFFHPYFHIYLYTIISYSEVLGVIFILSPVILAFLPTIVKKKLHIEKFIATIYSFLAIIIFLVLTLIVGYFTKNFFEKFSYKKWNNSNYCDMRYMMIESLEKKYSFIGMNKKNIYNILGKIEDKSCMHDYEEDNKICYMTYEIEEISRNYYCLYLDENGIVTSAKYEKAS